MDFGHERCVWYVAWRLSYHHWGTWNALLKNRKIEGTELSAEIFENAARKVLENVGRKWKWRHNFGIYALMFSEPGRFTWFTEAVKDMMTDGTIMLLAAEGQGEFDWAAYIPNKWTVICNCLRKRLKVPRPIVEQPLTLAGAKELETNPTAAKTAIWTETWHPSWPIDDGVAGGGGPGGSRGGGSRGGRGGGSRGSTSPSYGFGLESSGKGGNSKSVPRPKGRGCVGSTNNGMMATLCFEPFDRTTAGPKTISTRNPKSSFMDTKTMKYESSDVVEDIEPISVITEYSDGTNTHYLDTYGTVERQMKKPKVEVRLPEGFLDPIIRDKQFWKAGDYESCGNSLIFRRTHNYILEGWGLRED